MAQRNALEARGYTRGGRAGNYENELVIDSAAAADTAALEVLQIFFEVRWADVRVVLERVYDGLPMAAWLDGHAVSFIPYER